MKNFCLPVISFLLLACGLSSCSTQAVHDAKVVDATPAIYPDYVGVTVPVGIAPLNFCMADSSALLVDAVVVGADGTQIHGQGAETTDFDVEAWHQLLLSSRGDSLRVTVSARFDDGWRTYSPFSIYVSTDSIDYGVAYRMLQPGYEVYSKMGIYQTCLASSQQTAIIENTQFQGCVNCHSFNRGNPADMSLHIRGEHGATLLRLSGKLAAYNTATQQTLGSCVYPYWHPAGRYIAFSTNTTRQVFHVRDTKRIEVFDSASDLQVYDTQTNELIITPLLMRPDVMETFPAFSADGRTLYFCAAQTLPEGSIQLDSIHYNLCSISFDPDRGTFGDRIDTLVNAVDQGKSISFPRPSYDGRFLVYAMADYGQFSIWHPEADLYIMDLADGSIRRMDDGVNSNDTESYHSWSSNSRWMAFSSRRDDGWFTRLYFTHISEDGTQTKPFMLPQRNPRRYYQDLFLSYNVPEFITGPVDFDSHAAADAIMSAERVQMGVRSAE